MRIGYEAINMKVDQKRFLEAKEAVTKQVFEKRGIGTLREKTVHAVMKQYYGPDPDTQEKQLGGLIADIFTGSEIIEIQTRSFQAMKKKLPIFLTLYPVTIVYPLPYRKWVIWMDENTGEMTPKRKSPKLGSIYDAFKELYWIKEFLGDERLTIKLVFLDIEEYRLLNGWSRDRKRGSKRYDRIPVSIVDEVEFRGSKDYSQLIPEGLEEPFGTADFARSAKIRQPLAGKVVHILCRLKQIEKAGKKGNSILYRKTD